MTSKIAEIERRIFELNTELNQLRRDNEGTEVKNYSFDTLDGSVSLLELFGDKDKLLVIHNMGQGCHYCTLWSEWICATPGVRPVAGFGLERRT